MQQNTIFLIEQQLMKPMKRNSYGLCLYNENLYRISDDSLSWPELQEYHEFK